MEKLDAVLLDKDFSWLDTGTFDSLHEANSLIKTLEHNQGLRIGYPEEIAWRMKWIDTDQLRRLASLIGKNEYGQYLSDLSNE